MKILVLNAGSSSHKSCLYEIEEQIPEQPPVPVWEAQIDWQKQQNQAKLIVKTKQGKKLSEKLTLSSKREALSYLFNTLWQGSTQVIQSLKEIDLVGHRVVHGGQKYQSSVLITTDVKAEISRLSALAPLHNPANLEGIELMEEILGDIPQIAAFDTAFHSQIPDAAAIYPGSSDWIQQGIRRYGFHGISHRFCAQQASRILGQDLNNLRLIICHLGNGASLTAVKNGHSVDTTMGFTPVDGLMMGTRCGSIDPGIVIHLIRQGYSSAQLDQLLNRESGLKGISGVSHDWREIEQAIAQGNQQAKLARDIYLHRLKSCLGAMLMSLGGIDAIVFTAGIGEHSAWLRAKTCEALHFLGVSLDQSKNDNSPVNQDIATADSKIPVLVIHTQEDWAIAQDCWEYLKSIS